MVAPIEIARLPLEVKYNLASYRVWLDCRLALDILKNKSLSYVEWRIEWAGICSLLRTSIHVMRAKDAKSCLPEELRNRLKRYWDDLFHNKPAYPLYNEFIHKERNNILKEYEFSAYEAIIAADGTIKPKLSLLYILQDGEKEALVIRSGHYAGRPALEVLDEAVEWTKNYIYSAIREAGYDPEEPRYPGTLLPIEPNAPPGLRLVGLLSGDDIDLPTP